MLRRLLKRWLVLVPLVAALAAGGWQLVRAELEERVASAIADEAAALGLTVEYSDLRVHVDGSVRIDDVRVGGTAVGQIHVPRIDARVDLGRALSGDLYLSRIDLIGPRLRLSEPELLSFCTNSGLCEAPPPSRARPAVARGASVARPPRLTGSASPRWVAPAHESPVGEVRVLGLVVEVLGAAGSESPYLALYQFDLRLWAGVDRYHLGGGGHLVSVLTNGDGVPFEVSGDWSVAGEEFGLVVDLEPALEIETPGGLVSFEQVGVRVGEHSDVWVQQLRVLPSLIDFTDQWRAESVEAVLSVRSGLLPERVIVDGLKGQLDVLALSDFAEWLAAEPDDVGDSDSRQLDLLREAIVDSLGSARSALYGSEISFEASQGDIRLSYADGSELSVSSLNFDLDGDQAAVSLSYHGKEDAAGAVPTTEASGSVEFWLNQLTAAGIAAWAR